MAARKSRKKIEKGEAHAPATHAGASEEDSTQRIIDATMDLIAGRGWRNIALADIAAASGLTLAQLYAIFPSKLAVLDAFERRINEKTLEGSLDVEDSVRDRLFELIMRRFDALAPYKPALRVLLNETVWDPTIALYTGPRFLNAMRWIGEAAGLETAGLGGILRINGLAAVYLSTLRVWLDDDTPDNTRTMAALDRALKRAELFVRSVPAFRRRGSAATA